MTHPEEQLAAYTEGMLDQRERAEVESHLSTCALCREEVALARGAVRALASLPDEPVPLGAMNHVTAEIGRMVRTPPRMPWRARLQWAAGLAAAAAVVALLAITLPRLGGGPSQGSVGGTARAVGGAAEGIGQPTASRAGTLHLEIHPNTDYDAASLQRLAQNAVTRFAVPRPSAADVQAPQDLIPASAAQAEACVAGAAEPTPGDRLVQLIQAKYEGTPAYLGVYLTGAGAGQAPTKVVIWAVARDGCRILSFSSQRI